MVDSIEDLENDVSGLLLRNDCFWTSTRWEILFFGVRRGSEGQKCTRWTEVLYSTLASSIPPVAPRADLILPYNPNWPLRFRKGMGRSYRDGGVSVATGGGGTKRWWKCQYRVP